MIRYGNKSQSSSDQMPTLFGNISNIEVIKPKPAKLVEWPPLVKLNKEKEVIGIYLSSHPLDNFKLEMTQFCNTKLSELREMDRLKGKEIVIGGMITSVRHATTKTGKPFGVLALEDYSDTFSMMLFNKDYENFRKYLYDGYSLLIKGTVAESTWKANGEPEFRIKSIHMLSSVREELVKTILIRMPVEFITERFTDDLSVFVHKNGGTTNLKILVYDPEDNVSVDFFCRSYRINLENEFIDFLNSNREIEYKLM
jgi:DNA polymerase-3 subunit alpha